MNKILLVPLLVLAALGAIHLGHLLIALGTMALLAGVVTGFILLLRGDSWFGISLFSSSSSASRSSSSASRFV